MSDEEKKKMRQELWNKFFQEQDGIKASDLSGQLEEIRAVYEGFGKHYLDYLWRTGQCTGIYDRRCFMVHNRCGNSCWTSML